MGFFLKNNKINYITILGLAIIAYTLLFSIATVNKHRSFYSYAWDLGVFNQAIYNSIFENKLFHYTCDSYLNIRENYFAFHFSPILALVFPAYFLVPRASTLLIIKSLLIALGAFPLYLVGEKITGKKTLSLIVALVYLIQPGTQASNWFDFQPQVFIPLCLFGTFLFFLEGKWRYFFPSLVLSLLIEEHVFIIYITMVMGYYLVEKGQIVKLFDLRNERTRNVYLSFVVSGLIFILGLMVKSRYPVNNTYIDIFQATKGFEVLAFKGSGFTLPFYAITNPGKCLQALGYDLDLKFLYIIFLYGPLLFLPLLSTFAVPSIFLYMPFLLSNYRAYYTLGAHYYLYLVTSIFIGLLYSLRSIGDKTENYSKQLVTLSLFFILLLSPLSPASQLINGGQEILWYPTLERTENEIMNLRELLDLIPKDASILTMNHIFPQVSGRLNAYVIPVLQTDEKISSDLKLYIREIIDKSDYILMDLNVMDSWSKFTFESISSSDDFGVFRTKGNMVLFARGDFTNNLPGESIQTFTTEDLLFRSHEMVTDEDNVPVAKYVNKDESGLFVYGPYVFLPSGNYRVKYHMMVDSSDSKLLGYIQINQELDKIITKRNLWNYDLKPGEWQEVEVIIGLEDVSMLTEFKLYSYGVEIYFKDVEIELLDSKEIYSSTRSFTSEDLSSPLGVQVDNLLLYNSSGSSHVFWYGPYYSVNPGTYVVDYMIQLDPRSENCSNDILTLDIVTSKNLEKIAEYNVSINEVSPENWSKVSLQFSIEHPLCLEFRGMNPSDYWNIWLSEVRLTPIIPDNIIEEYIDTEKER